MTRWCVSVIQPTVTVSARSPCLLWVSTPPTWPAWPATDWRQVRVGFRWTALRQVSDVVGLCCWDGWCWSIHTASLLFIRLFQASGWRSFPTRSTRRSGDSVELWQTQQPLTSCLFLLVHKTSCYDSTFPLKVHQVKGKQSSGAIYQKSIIWL